MASCPRERHEETSTTFCERPAKRRSRPSGEAKPQQASLERPSFSTTKVQISHRGLQTSADYAVYGATACSRGSEVPHDGRMARVRRRICTTALMDGSGGRTDQLVARVRAAQRRHRAFPAASRGVRATDSTSRLYSAARGFRVGDGHHDL